MIQWNITEKQADQILQTLATRPFAEVNELIQELLRQAQKPRPLEVVPPVVEPGAA
jgi:hypothetical protein